MPLSPIANLTASRLTGVWRSRTQGRPTRHCAARHSSGSDGAFADTKAEEEPDTKKAAKADNGGDSGPSIVEEGRLAFFYRPKVEVQEAHSVDDVQRCASVAVQHTGHKVLEAASSGILHTNSRTASLNVQTS